MVANQACHSRVICRISDALSTVTPNAGDLSGVTGFQILTNNGHQLQRDGEQVRIPVVRGKAEFDLTWPSAGEQVIVATFVGAEGEAMGTGTKTVNITDESATDPTDPTDPNPPGEGGDPTDPETPGEGEEPTDPDVGGELPDGGQGSTPSGSSAIASFFEHLWQWIVDLFTGNRSSGSSLSSNR